MKAQLHGFDPRLAAPMLQWCGPSAHVLAYNPNLVNLRTYCSWQYLEVSNESYVTASYVPNIVRSLVAGAMILPREGEI
jgi:hypothetical protein